MDAHITRPDRVAVGDTSTSHGDCRSDTHRDVDAHAAFTIGHTRTQHDGECVAQRHACATQRYTRAADRYDTANSRAERIGDAWSVKWLS
jgi:hypothetical protein